MVCREGSICTSDTAESKLSLCLCPVDKRLVTLRVADNYNNKAEINARSIDSCRVSAASRHGPRVLFGWFKAPKSLGQKDFHSG